MPSGILDNFEDRSGWTAVTSGETQLTRSSADGPVGKPMRLHFDFCAGGGFVVARGGLPPELPQTYSFGFVIQGEAPDNIFELPGSVEFGDFDPAATAIALSPIDETHRLPESAINRTFDKYLEGFRDRVSGQVAWNNYSAYEIRIIGTLVRLGRRRDALEITEFMLKDRRIQPWNQWPEISWRDPSCPSFIGDLPHTWISGEYILAVRSLFAYEREADDALVLAAGIDGEWLADRFEVAVENLPT